MGYDTIRLRSPLLDDSTASQLAGKLDLISRANQETGEIQWSITTGSVQTSHESSISCRIAERPEGKYLCIEGSVHKMLLGQNVLGNPDGFQDRAKDLVDFVDVKLGVPLPFAPDWDVMRVDVAMLFDLASASAVTEFFRGMRGTIYPRRKVSQYGLESIYAPGVVTSVKLYHKGPEFQKHGRDWRKSVCPEWADFVQKAADCRLRCEVEIKARRLARLVSGRRGRSQPKVRDLTDAKLEAIYDAELDRLLRERKHNFGTVRRQEEVHGRLRGMYRRGRADDLYGFWSLLIDQGEDAIREKLPRATFYRKRKLLLDADIAWRRTDAPDAAGTPSPLETLTLRSTDPHRCRLTVAEVQALQRRIESEALIAAGSSAGG